MKKLTALLLAGLMLIASAACTPVPDTPETEGDTTVETPTEAPTEAPTTLPPTEAPTTVPPTEEVTEPETTEAPEEEPTAPILIAPRPTEPAEPENRGGIHIGWIILGILAAGLAVGYLMFGGSRKKGKFSR